MKLILLSHILEHSGFPLFLEEMVAQYPDVSFLVAGDLLNTFPEPGEDLAGSIYTEIFGLDHLQNGIEQLIRSQFQNIATSPLITPLQQMFCPLGRHYKTAQMLAHARYHKFFATIGSCLLRHQSRFIFIPGNMDYPYLAHTATALQRDIVQLDMNYIPLNNWKIGGIGGIPNTVHPFQGVGDMSPYEMTASEYQRRLNALWGVDVLITHVSPEEFPPLAQFIQDSPLKVLVCQAPFNYQGQLDYRGSLMHRDLHGTLVTYIRPFDYPKNSFYMLTLDEQGIECSLERLTWQADMADNVSPDQTNPQVGALV